MLKQPLLQVTLRLKSITRRVVRVKSQPVSKSTVSAFRVEFFAPVTASALAVKTLISQLSVELLWTIFKTCKSCKTNVMVSTCSHLPCNSNNRVQARLSVHPPMPLRSTLIKKVQKRAHLRASKTTVKSTLLKLPHLRATISLRLE